MVTWREICIRRSRVLRELIEEARQLTVVMVGSVPPDLAFLRERIASALSETLIEAIFCDVMVEEHMTLQIIIPVSGTSEVAMLDAALAELGRAWEECARVARERVAGAIGEPVAAKLTITLC